MRDRMSLPRSRPGLARIEPNMEEREREREREREGTYLGHEKVHHKDVREIAARKDKPRLPRDPLDNDGQQEENDKVEQPLHGRLEAAADGTEAERVDFGAHEPYAGHLGVSSAVACRTTSAREERGEWGRKETAGRWVGGAASSVWCDG